MIENLLSSELGRNLFTALKYVYISLPFLLPVVFLITAFRAWLYYKRSAYWRGMGDVLLELKFPREIFKSPLAMELVLNQMHQTADEGNWYFKYWKGQTRSWFSLEIISIGGQIHFYIWARKKYKNGIEAHLYSQYPGIEIYEVEDYTKNYNFDPEKHQMFACQWELAEPDPLPIGTYVDYGMDKDPKEEYKIDPMTSQLEFLGTLTKGHNMWIQIIVRAHKKDRRKPGTWFDTTDAWKDESRAQIDKIIERFRPKEGSVRQPTEGEKNIISALERSVGKIGFDTTIRSIYFADKDLYNSIYLGGLMGSFKQYGSMGLNSFKSAGWYSTYNNPWKDWMKTISKAEMGKMIMEEYKFRRFFFSPYRGKWFYSKPFILNSEELATIFHIPSAVATTPTLERIPSKKAEAPSNLPL